MKKYIIVLISFFAFACGNPSSDQSKLPYGNCEGNSGIVFKMDSLFYYGTCVESLILDNDTIGKISSLVANLNNLKEVEIMNCQISDLKDLFLKLSKVKNLNKLVIDIKGHNKIPIEIGQMKNIQELTLILDSTKSLPNSFYALTQLKSLHIIAAHYTQDVRLLQLKELVNFGLSANLGAMPEVVLGLKDLRKLDLSENPIKEIPTSIESLGKLQELKIYRTDIERNEMKRLKDGLDLKELPRLKELCHNCEVLSNIVSFK